MTVVVRGNVPIETSAFDRRRLRSEIGGWMKRERCSHALTLNANRGFSVPKISKMFGNFCLEVDRTRADKKNVSSIAAGNRLFAIAFVEHPETNIHLHAALRLEGWWPHNIDIAFTFDLIWRRITRSAGSLLLKGVRDQGWATYITKAANVRAGDFLFAADYHPR